MDALLAKDHATSLLSDEEPSPYSLSLQAYLDGLVAAPLYNVPVTLTDFVGRRDELDMLRALLSQQRLVTLVGLGGMGKTRLALQIAAEMRLAFGDGVCFAPLAAVAMPDFLIPALAEAVQLPAAPGADLKRRLLDYLRNKELLLVLDNFEHLVSAAGLLTEILQSAPGVRVVVTSRERLNLYEEWVFEVGGLRLPDGETAQAVDGSDAAQLFLQSARRVCPGFALTEGEEAQVARICRLVDGLPLALELAGGWMKLLSCEEIAAGIEEDLGFLSADWANVPERHRSMPVVFERSWRMLAEREQQVLARLSVFAGGFTKEAAAQVAGATLADLAALAAHSFVSRNPERKRYEIHPLLRRYAGEKLGQAEAYQEVGDRHCEFYTAFLREREETVRGKDQRRVLQEIGEELDNVRAAWRWAVERGKTGCVAGMLETLYQFYETRSRFQEGAEVFAWAAQTMQPRLDGADGTAERIVHTLEMYRSVFLFRLGKVQEARDILEKKLEVFRVKEEWLAAAFCLSQLARIATLEGKLDQTKLLAGEGVSLARAARLQQGEVENLYRLGTVAYHQNNYEDARQFFQQALQIYQEMGDPRGEGVTFHALGATYLDVEDYERAIHHYQQELDIFSRLEDLYWLATSLDALGSAHCCRGDYAEARTYYEQALALKQKIGNRDGEGLVLSNLGNLFLSLGAYQQAEIYIGQALHLFREMGRRLNESIVLSNAGWLAYHFKHYQVALENHQQALLLAREIGNQSQQGYALNGLGWVWLELGQLTEAVAAYEESSALLREIGQHGQALAPSSGLARVALIRENLTQAQECVDKILEELRGQAPGSEVDLFQIYLTCYHVLHAAQNPHAEEVLETARNLLQEQAARINDEALRHSFLHNVPSHRQIEAEFAALTGEPSAGKGASAQANTPVAGLIESLTPQELTIVRLLAEGLTNQQIAERLFITVGTVKFHTHSIYGKLGVENRTGAVARARDLKVI